MKPMQKPKKTQTHSSGKLSLVGGVGLRALADQEKKWCQQYFLGSPGNIFFDHRASFQEKETKTQPFRHLQHSPWGITTNRAGTAVSFLDGQKMFIKSFEFNIFHKVVGTLGHDMANFTVYSEVLRRESQSTVDISIINQAADISTIYRTVDISTIFHNWYTYKPNWLS